VNTSHVAPLRLIPGGRVPDLHVSLTGGGDWVLEGGLTGRFTLLVFYRGLHCPLCARYLSELDTMLTQFDELQTNVVAVSMDTAERAQAAKAGWKLRRLKIGYGLDRLIATHWGLYLSQGNGKTAAGIEEPELFNEPALFLIKADATLYYSAVQTMPFARPGFGDLANAIGFVIHRNYPARGTFVLADGFKKP
jgi:peroxiredoxin